MTDPRRQGSNENLTINYFLSHEYVMSFPDYENEKIFIENNVVPARKEMLEVRNKLLAHLDLEYNSNLEGKYLPGFKYIDAVIAGCLRFYDYLNWRINDVGGSYRSPLRGGAKYVFSMLKDAN